MALPARYRDDFIELLAGTGSVSRSAAALGVSRLTPYRWREEDPAFAYRWERALDVARQGLRDRVVETASEMGLGRWLPAVDGDGRPVLDDDFEPVLRFETGHVEARVLMKLMDKTMSDSPTTIEARLRASPTVLLRERLDLDSLSDDQLVKLRDLLGARAGAGDVAVIEAEAVEVADER